ncbi:MAG: hypothetical protein V4702_00420 [Patescibacteria group bacterium]
MKKQSIILVLAGAVVLAIGYFAFISISRSDSKPTSDSASPASTNGSVETIEVDIAVPSTEIKTIRVKQYRKVIVKLTSQVNDQAHLHGYDILTDLEAGKVATLEFTADKTGRFELETETAEQQLAIFEVYP